MSPLRRTPSWEIPRVAGTGLPIRPSMPRPPTKPTVGKGPRSVQPGLVTERWNLPPQPPDFVGTKPEWLVYWALTRLGYVPNEDFTFQTSEMGVRWERGAAVVDFLVLRRTPPLVIRVQGLHWHYAGAGKEANDRMQKQDLETHGMEVVDIDEDMADADPIYYVQEALLGIDHSRGPLEA